MDTKLILGFLREVMMNNNRPWFQAHKDEYQSAKPMQDFMNSVIDDYE
jgi:uncharacterized protein (DUF2461 family)